MAGLCVQAPVVERPANVAVGSIASISDSDPNSGHSETDALCQMPTLRRSVHFLVRPVKGNICMACQRSGA